MKVSAEMKYFNFLLLDKNDKELVEVDLERFDEKNYLSDSKIQDMEFLFVKRLMNCIIKNDIDEFASILSEKEEYKNENILGKKTYEVILSLKYLMNEIVKMIEIEDKLLTSNVSRNENSDLIEQVDFSIFPGYYHQLRDLAGGDILKFEEIGKLPYSDCLLELAYRQKQSDLEYLVSKRAMKKA